MSPLFDSDLNGNKMEVKRGTHSLLGFLLASRGFPCAPAAPEEIWHSAPAMALQFAGLSTGYTLSSFLTREHSQLVCNHHIPDKLILRDWAMFAVP